MKIAHWVRKEQSGLAVQTVDLAEAEERLGHEVCMVEPSTEMPFYGTLRDIDVHAVHSQLGQSYYHDNKPKLMWMHGEPLSSVGNGVSMKAICDLAPLMDAFVCMRRDEEPIWNRIKRTFWVGKGINLNTYHPLEGVTEKLSGAPCVLYYENWRGARNPLYLIMAMVEVHKKYPDARLHLFNCRDKKMKETFEAVHKTAKTWPFLRTIQGGVDSGQAVNLLLNRCDIVVSCLYPLYARTPIEAFAAGKGAICPGYREYEYPYQCELDPQSMADAICKCWEEYGQFDFRKHAVQHHDVDRMAAYWIKVVERYL